MDNQCICGDINPAEVIAALKKFKSNGDTGISDLPLLGLKNLPRSYLDRLTPLFNNWWNNLNYPIKGQQSKITLLPKAGKDHTKLQGYRTLSVGCNLCKIYLRILEARLLKITEKSNLLGETQNGFRPGRQGTDNILILNTVNRIVRKKGWKSFFTFIDLTKAFDRINRDKLWEKMRWYGFPDKLIDAIAQTYNRPTAILGFQKIYTEPLEMPVGLRQGCVLSSMLFAIYMADFSFMFNRLDTGVPLQYFDK